MEYSELLTAAKLLLELQAPSLEDCWQHGYETAGNGSLDDNPHAPGSTNYQHWSDGWWAGFYEGSERSYLDGEKAIKSSASNDRFIEEIGTVLGEPANSLMNN